MAETCIVNFGKNKFNFNEFILIANNRKSPIVQSSASGDRMCRTGSVALIESLHRKITFRYCKSLLCDNLEDQKCTEARHININYEKIAFNFNLGSLQNKILK